MVVERIVDAKIRVEKERKQVKDEAAAAAGVDASGAAPSEAETEAAAAGAGGGGKRSKRCGICVGCRAKSCDRCKYCLDSKKNNGPNKLKQPCIKRRCRNLPGDAIDWTVRAEYRKNRRVLLWGSVPLPTLCSFRICLLPRRDPSRSACEGHGQFCVTSPVHSTSPVCGCCRLHASSYRRRCLRRMQMYHGSSLLVSTHRSCSEVFPENTYLHVYGFPLWNVSA